MFAIIVLAVAALVALMVFGSAIHVLFSPGCCWRPSPSWPGSSSGRAAPAGSGVTCRPRPGAPVAGGRPECDRHYRYRPSARAEARRPRRAVATSGNSAFPDRQTYVPDVAQPCIYHLVAAVGAIESLAMTHCGRSGKG